MALGGLLAIWQVERHSDLPTVVDGHWHSRQRPCVCVFQNGKNALTWIPYELMCNKNADLDLLIERFSIPGEIEGRRPTDRNQP